MLRKLYEGMKKFIKKNYHDLLFVLGLIVIWMVMTYPLPYYILTSGGIIAVSDRVEVENGYQEEGSFNLAYVNELRGTIPTYLLSHIISDWTLYEAKDYAIDESETVQDIELRDQLSLKESQQNAVKVAYESAGKEFKIKNTNFYLYYVEAKVKKEADMRVGDRLIAIDGVAIDDIDKYSEYVQTKNVGDTVSIELERNGKKHSVKVKVYEEDGHKITGIMIFKIYDYEVDPSIKFNFKNSESGPSGGMTLALSIYNKLTEEDITKGKKIVGTGTIDEDGLVGEIGGIKYKLQGAVKGKADVFIAPSGDNYQEVMALKEEKGYDIKIIEATNFLDVLQQLRELD